VAQGDRVFTAMRRQWAPVADTRPTRQRGRLGTGYPPSGRTSFLAGASAWWCWMS